MRPPRGIQASFRPGATVVGTSVAVCVTLGSITLLQPVAVRAQIPTFDPGSSRTSFDAMAEYLARDGGRWRGENPNHDPARARSPTHFGLWFVRSLHGHVLDLTIVSHLSDTTVVNSEARWVWHPGREELTYVSVGRNGALSEGTTEFTDARTFRTLTMAHAPSGAASEHRDDNVIVDGDTHRNASFRRARDGGWVEQGQWVWVRDRASPTSDANPAPAPRSHRP